MCLLFDANILNENKSVFQELAFYLTPCGKTRPGCINTNEKTHILVFFSQFQSIVSFLLMFLGKVTFFPISFMSCDPGALNSSRQYGHTDQIRRPFIYHFRLKPFHSVVKVLQFIKQALLMWCDATSILFITTGVSGVKQMSAKTDDKMFK